MRFSKTCLTMVATWSILLLILACSEEEKNVLIEPPPKVDKIFPDLSIAIQKRVEKKPEEAIDLLRQYDKDFPNSPKILVQLSRALVEAGNFSLGAFRFEQVISISPSPDLIRECGEAYMLAGDSKSAQKKFKDYLKIKPENEDVWLLLARILEKDGSETDALNAFEQAKEKTTADDCLKVGNLYIKKKIFVRAENWFKDAAQKELTATPAPLIGLLKVKLFSSDFDSVEALILGIEKKFPFTLEKLSEKQKIKNILVSRRLTELNEREIVIQNSNISQLAQALLQEPKKIEEPVVSNGPKLSSLFSSSEDSINQSDFQIDVNSSTDFTSSSEKSIADVFKSTEEKSIEPDPVELGWSAYLSRNYATALQQAQIAINNNSKNSEAWRLSSQVNFQLGKMKEAEMTILEAIRHDPRDLTTRVDYLNIARETLSSDRYLQELEKTHELFPDSKEILWQLARRYHLVERMPVTAGILYRRLLKIAPEDSLLHSQAKMELIKVQDL